MKTTFARNLGNWAIKSIVIAGAVISAIELKKQIQQIPTLFELTDDLTSENPIIETTEELKMDDIPEDVKSKFI